MNRRFTPAVVLWLLASLFILTRPAVAQETTGTLAGTVLDPQGLALPGVTLTLVGPQGTTTAVTDGLGQFLVPHLVPGSYVVRAALAGFRTAEIPEAVVRLGQTLTLALKLELGRVDERVTVGAETPVISITTSTVGAVIDGRFVADLPVGRRVSDLTYLAPGVTKSGSLGHANPSLAGGAGLDNQYVIDGVNVTNQGYGALGSFSYLFGSLGNATPADFIQEVQVKTGGYEAEFGQAMGGVVNVVTKSGTNRLTGSVFGYARPAALEAAWTQLQVPNGVAQTLGTRVGDLGTEVGGPLTVNRAFLFTAIDTQWDRHTLQAPDDFPLRSLGGVPRDRRNVSYATKASWVPRPQHRIDASFFGDPSTGEMGPQRATALLGETDSAFSALKYGGHNQTVRYSGLVRSRWFVEGTFARAANRVRETPKENAWQILDTTVTPLAQTGGVGFFEDDSRSENHQWAVKATNVFGRHQLRYGAEYNDVEYEQAAGYSGPTFTVNGRTTASGAVVWVLPDVTFGRIYQVVRASFTHERLTFQRYFTAFAQETWSPAPGLSVTAGLRYEQQTLDGTVVQGLTFDGNWAPRLGVTWDPTRSGRMKVFGHYGRFFARVPNDLAARALSLDEAILHGDFYDAALTRLIPDGVVTQTPGGFPITEHFITGGGTLAVDPDAKLTYLDEVVLGVEREIAPRTALAAHYTWRSIGRVLEDVANVPAVAYYLGIPGLEGVEYILTNPSSRTPILPTAEFLGASFDDPVHRYHALSVSLRRSSRNWSALASYQWSQLRGNYEGFYRDDNGQPDPGITSLFDFPTNDPSFTAVGRDFGFRGDIRHLGTAGILPLDRPHQIKLYSSYLWSNGLTLGLAVTMQSGKPLTALASNPVYSNGGEIPEGPRGSGFETVDGFRTRSPFERQVDLHASWNLRAGGRRTLTLIGQVFNVFNDRRPTDYDPWTEYAFHTPNPVFGMPVNQVVGGLTFHPPLAVRIGARFGF